MGNISSGRRPSSSRTTSQSAAQWDEANVLRLISENKLAPKYTDKLAHDQTAQSVECPICFLDFAVINTVHCCKQYICTDCVVQMKGTEGKGACPFCGNVEMQVSLIPLKESKKAPQATPAKNKDERSNSLSETDAPSNRSSETGRVSLSYTTPEQEKKLRSLSMDADSGNTSAGNSVVATKTDREALERQIREQRLQFDERDMAQAAQSTNRGTYFSSGARGSSTANASYFRSARYRMTSNNGLGSPASPSQRFPAAAGGGSGNSAAGSSASAGNARLVDTIEGLLQARGGIGGISSIQQLEEIMLMEAIRLSMQDVPASTEDASASTGTQPAAAHTPSSTNTTANMTAMGSPYNTISNTTASTPVVPRSPARTSPMAPSTAQVAAASPARQPVRTSPRHVYRSSSSSRSSSDLEEDSADIQYGRSQHSAHFAHHAQDDAADYGAERESDGDYRFSAGSDSQAEARESDMLSDEEEQLRMALAMSLASLKTEQETQQQQEQSQQDAAAEKNEGDGKDITGGLSMNAISVDLALSAPDAEQPVLKMSAQETSASTEPSSA